MTGNCLVCEAAAVELLIDLGPQPFSNRYLTSPDQPESRHPLRLGECSVCGLIQLLDPAPPEEIRSPFEWIRYNEPEGHLDEVARALRDLDGPESHPFALGVSYKDDSTLDRLAVLGCGRTARLDPGTDLQIDYPAAGLETIQRSLEPHRATVLARKIGPADLLIARHVLEHAQRTREFVAALRRLVRPGGYLVLEVPDCERALELGDCTMLWEHHVLYFTAETLRTSLTALGLEIVALNVYPYPTENSLVAIVRNAAPVSGEALPKRPAARGRAFVDRMRHRSRIVRAELQLATEQGSRVAMFGAGHLACIFINTLDLKETVRFVVDDDPHKRGMFMPGSRLPIRPSSALLEERVDLCLSSLSPESHRKVLDRSGDFLAQAGVFRSIFPTAAESAVTAS